MHNCPNCGINLRNFDAFSYGNVTINESGQLLLNGEVVDIAPKPRKVAEILIRANSRVMPRGAILNALDPDEAMEIRTVDVYVRRIRRACEKVDPNFDQLKLARGDGYYWKKKAAPVEQEQPSLLMAA